MSTTYYASSHGGSRYHVSPVCTGLNSTELAGDPVIGLTRRQVAVRELTPCGTCHPSPLLAAVPTTPEETR